MPTTSPVSDGLMLGTASPSAHSPSIRFWCNVSAMSLLPVFFACFVRGQDHSRRRLRVDPRMGIAAGRSRAGPEGRDLWASGAAEARMPDRVLVTGISGFVGGHVAL